jgi:hypothetical protein
MLNIVRKVAVEATLEFWIMVNTWEAIAARSRRAAWAHAILCWKIPNDECGIMTIRPVCHFLASGQARVQELHERGVVMGLVCG